MHLMVIIREDLPEMTMTGEIGKFIKKISSKQYKAQGVTDPWAKIRAREIRFYDFTIPESIEDEVLTDLYPYCAGKINRLSKIADIPLLKGIINKTLGIKAVDMDKYSAIINNPETKTFKERGVVISILGKVEDDHLEWNGRECL